MKPSRSLLQNVVLAMRREDPARIWERRAPLTPDAVHHLVEKDGVEVLVEPCERRVFTAHEYEKAGAKITSSFDRAHVVIGIKENPMDALAGQRAPVAHGNIPRTQVMFSHTAKGQTYNTGLLSQFVAPTDGVLAPSAAEFEKTLELWPRLIDYELLTNDKGKRTVGFGWYAGVAGVLESLSAMAHAHLELGIASPFLYTPRPHTLPCLERLRVALREVGQWISTQGTPRALGPLVICVTGTGNVAQGCLSILDDLPLKKIDVRELESLIYLVHAKPQDYLVRKDGKSYDREDYYANPSEWQSLFGERIMPYVTLFLNGTGWASGFPSILTTQQLSNAISKAQSLGIPSAVTRARCIGDISCDIGGGLEFLERSTTISEPTYKFAVSDTSGDITMMSVDILPTALPLDASRHFSKEFFPYLRTLINQVGKSNNKGGGEELARALERATIASNGKLKEKHQWLQPAVDQWHQEQRGVKGIHTNDSVQVGGTGANGIRGVKKKKMVMFGSGMVAGPAVEEIAKRGDVELVIATNLLGEAQKLAIRYGQEHNNIKYRIVDVAKKETYEHLVNEADVVISLLPAAYHVDIAEMCISGKKHLVTASYISEPMRHLHDRALSADVLLLNEIGLDPGIDHCSAISLINDLKAKGKQVVSFTSFCGGLPAPDSIFDTSSSSTMKKRAVPLKYKFSWSPVGVLRAANQGVRYLLNEKVVKLPGEELLRSGFPRLPISIGKEGEGDGVELEGMPNRDSLPYRETYGLRGEEGESLRTLVRGTLRYPGFCTLMQSFKDIGLLEDGRKIQIGEWSEFLRQVLAVKLGSSSSLGLDGRDKRSLESALRDVQGVGEKQYEEMMGALEWLGLLNGGGGGGGGKKMMVPMKEATPLELFAMVLGNKLKYGPMERDMVVLSHEVIVRNNQNQQHQHQLPQEEVHRSTLVAYGDESASAMAKTVGLPVAFAALDVLDGKVGMRGVCGPNEREIYESVLGRLEEVGLGMVESVDLVGREGLRTVEESLRG
ncbi:hypothetical protein AGABI2DRAFT_188762 [Agaricus bisporus var. bisporus H97]|uniref:hypothetical protein n=1 Tax=Agaricus bisporus var. bisporus (strain H97 / ATCC MYA-4626 / FGSC 10389) TaxID=936046 RepID=UPI00029F5C3C|nr:hypothetical protein AGABI2DRAFT_188762 [Agaricus bisporus var. bisporus H97]EKV42163.1 hypothetical protein AGABI2DRAFT_188762 [Agaricus bisporus var. bisporus H97]